MVRFEDGWTLAVTVAGAACLAMAPGCGGHESQRRSGSTVAAATSSDAFDAPAYIPGDVMPVGSEAPPMTEPPAAPAAPTTPRHWYQGDTVGNPLKVHSPEEECLASSLLQEINCKRKNAGLKKLVLDPEATRPAKAHAEDMAGRLYFGAVTPEGLRLQDRLQLLEVKGYTEAAENLATGFKKAKEVVKGWMDSPPNRDNLLAARFTHVGIGVALEPSPHASVVFLTRGAGESSSTAAPTKTKTSCATH